MFTTCHPIDRNHCDSARVENRGPLMTTIVPPSCTVAPISRPAVTSGGPQPGVIRFGEGLMVDGWIVVVRVGAAPGAVDELVDDDEVAGVEVGLQRADRARADDRADAERPERVDVGAKRHPMRRETGGPCRGGAGTPPGGRPTVPSVMGAAGSPYGVVDIDFLDVVEELVETRPADDADLGAARLRASWWMHHASAAGPRTLPVPPDEPDEPDELDDDELDELDEPDDVEVLDVPTNPMTPLPSTTSRCLISSATPPDEPEESFSPEDEPPDEPEEPELEPLRLSVL